MLFLFEDIDYYVETTKQVLLYKILDMLTYVKIKFVLLATSMKLDVADSFEKRIKSRFSHRQVLLYSLEMKKFNEVVSKVFASNIDFATQNGRKESVRAFKELKALAESSVTQELLEPC